MSSEVLIKVQNLSKIYQIYEKPSDRLKQFFWRKYKKFFKEVIALDSISFEIKKGEIVGIIGRNGAGKSTLLQIISGTLEQTAGKVEINGRIAALLELGAGFNPEFTGKENVYMNTSILGFSQKEIDSIYDKIIAFADIGDFIDQPVKIYSSGMYARLAFASTIFVDPDILIIDEILAVGDAPFQRKCLNEFHKLRDKGCTIFLVSHDAYLIKNFCHQALYLNKGKLSAYGNSHTVVDKYLIEVESALTGYQNNISSTQEPVKTTNTDLTSLNLFQIKDVKLFNSKGIESNIINSNESMSLQFEFETLTENPPDVTFVFSLYRHDGIYICGKTSLMDGLKPIKPKKLGKIKITFPSVKLLAGKYYWRVAIDDDRGFGIYVEENNVYEFLVVDKMEAVGMFNLENSWSIEMEDNNGKNR